MTDENAFKFFGPTEKAVFLSRPNRFVLICKLRGRTVQAFLPNPGRLSELLLPDTPVYLEKTSNPNRSLQYTAVALEREGLRIVLHTHRTNDVARYLIESGSVPGLSDHEVIRREVTHGNSRFDFLLRKGNQEMFLEVKSCTLFSKRVAMFPDAVTARGKKHLEELTRLSADGASCAVLFLVHWPRAEVFLPDFHTDLEFSKTMKDAKNKVRFFPISVEWGENLSLVSGRTKVLPVLWQALEREAEDRGSYLVIYHLPRKRLIEIGGLGKVTFRQGYYVYVGSAMRNLSQRVERHRRIRKKVHWHIDYFSGLADFRTALPVRSEDDLECELASAMGNISEWSVPGFGCSDCSCPSHLFGFTTDPMSTRQFHDLLQYYRMDRLLEKYQPLIA
jgi:sugar fermentation stimulation protein A